MKTRQTSVINRRRSRRKCFHTGLWCERPPGPTHTVGTLLPLTGNTHEASFHAADLLTRAGSTRTCVFYGSGTVPIVLLDTRGWRPGTALAWTFGPGSKNLQPWPGKSSKWADSSHSAQRTAHSCTFFHCQERGRVCGGSVWGHLDWTGLKGQSSLHQKGTHLGNPTQFAAVFGLSDAKSVAVAAFLDEAGGGFRAPLRAANAAEAFVCFPRRMSVKGSLIFIHIL